MFKTIQTLDKRAIDVLEEIEKAVIVCTKQLAEPGQTNAVRKQAAKMSKERIKELSEELIATVQQTAIVAICLCEGAERIGPEACRARLEIWQTDENVDPKGGD